ncbi:retrovirus-related pol polyprotein from transposon TNT 1-94 [Tanacetum coccineum]
MYEFYQQHRSIDKWTKDHPLEQVFGDPSKPVMTWSRLNIDAKMCMYALTVSTTEPKNIKEAMQDHSWIESMQEELHQFERLKVWKLVEKPAKRTIIGVKWLWKNQTDAENTVDMNGVDRARAGSTIRDFEEGLGAILITEVLEIGLMVND